MRSALEAARGSLGPDEITIVVDEADRARIPSPTGDRLRDIVVWLENGTTLSIAFGAWHVHADTLASPDRPEQQLIEIVAAIVRADILALSELDGNREGALGVIDRRGDDAIEKELTSPYSTGVIRLCSWDGTVDQIVSRGTQEPRSP
ncbi:MAG: hypothetical protein IT384_01425 [Deltaproteobacteria bacterium]|nr:hypothetical protein [Deltaproteobacteria bacterium]